MTAVLMTPPYLQFFDANGAPLAGGKVYTYTATGTFSTQKATFTTEAGDVEHPNPVILDAAGRPDTGNGSIWLSGTYDFVVTDANDVTIETTLNVTAFTALAASSNAYFETFSGTGAQTAFTTSDDLGTDEKAIYVWVKNGLEEHVTNGTFATDSGWTKGTGWTIGSGVATAAGAISTAIEQTSAVTVLEGQAYSVTYTITRSAGGLIPSIGGNSGTEQTASGTYTEVIVAGSTEALAFTGNSFTGTLDTISITPATSEGYEIQNPNLYTISGTTLTFTTAPAIGTNNIYVSAPSLLVGAASSSAADAAVSAAAALASENQAGVYAGQLTIVSTTSVAVGTGTKVFTVGASLSLNAGQFILIASDANPTVNYMWGTIASYSGTTLTVTVTAIAGSGTLADWTMYLTGERGATGATGQDGAGAWIRLETQEASGSATIDMVTGIDSTYKNYIITYTDVITTADDKPFHALISLDAGSTFKSGASDYVYGSKYIDVGDTAVTVDTSSGAAFIDLTGTVNAGGDTGESLSGQLVIPNPSSSLTKNMEYTTTFVRSSGILSQSEGFAAYVTATTAINGIRFLFTSGNITSGTFKLYGVL